MPIDTSVLERLPEPVLLLSARGETLFANRAFLDLANTFGAAPQLGALFGPPANVAVGEARRNGSANAFLPLVVGDDLSKGYRLTIGGGEADGTLAVQLTDLSDEVEWRHQLFLRNSELSVLSAIGAALSATLEMDMLARRIWEQTGRIMDHSNFFFALHDRESESIRFPIWVRDGQILSEEHSRPLQGGVTEHIIATGEPLLLNDDVAGQLEELGIAHIGPECLSFLGVPIVTDGETVGVLALQDPRTAGRYGKHELGVLSIVATQAGAAVRNARLFDATRRAYEELSATQAKLLEAERLRGVTETVGALNHEVNNPLATIVGTAQLLLRRDDLDADTRPRVDRMLEAAKRIQAVTSRMALIIQATSRPYPGQDTILDVRGSLARLDAAAGPNTAAMLHGELPADPAATSATEDQAAA
ncbi:MAG: GAF domain-containing protein [Candidatus Eisenbacteria bacterium]